MKRVLLDQGLGRDTATALRRLGWDVIHVGEVGLATAEDRDIIQFAHRENRVCVTRDADFHAILALSGANGPSVVRIRMEDVSAEEMVRILLTVWAKYEARLEEGAVVTVKENKMRLRPLPIGKK